MQEKFKHWNKYSLEEVQEIWDNSLITFDTNVLLGLYRISPKLSDLFFELTSKIKDRIFIPYHVAFEFHKNRFNVIVDNYSQLSKLKSEIDRFETDVQKSKFYNYLSSNIKRLIDKDIKAKIENIKHREAYYKSLEAKDSIYEKLDQILKDKIEERPTEEKLLQLHKKGKDRYSKKIPPGFQDSEKENGNKYGDFIIWNEILEKAKKQNKNVIFVTNEKKEDWLWVLKDGKRIGPRPELKEEFHNETSKKFQICNLENYIFSIAKLIASAINFDSTKKEFKFESLFENNFLKVTLPKVENNQQNNNLLQLQEEGGNIQKMIEDIVRKPEIDENQKKLLEDLRFRKKVIDEQITKLFSVKVNK